MSRLINADELIALFNRRSTINVVGDGLCKVIITRIEALPTVEAIPISFIKKFEKHCEEHDDWLANHEWSNHFDAPVISRLLEKWREENETETD